MSKRMGMTLCWLAILGLAGCGASTQNGPSPARGRQFTHTGIPAREYLVGGGFQIDYTAPANGTVYWVEETTGKILQTTSVTEDESVEFELDVMEIESDEFQSRIGIDLAKAKMSLYFIPRDEGIAGRFTDRGLPAREYQVGGGLDVQYKAPAEGTLYWVEENTGKILETQLVRKGEVVQRNRTPEQVAAASGNPANSLDVSLYFIPSVATR